MTYGKSPAAKAAEKLIKDDEKWRRSADKLIDLSETIRQIEAEEFDAYWPGMQWADKA